MAVTCFVTTSFTPHSNPIYFPDRTLRLSCPHCFQVIRSDLLGPHLCIGCYGNRSETFCHSVTRRFRIGWFDHLQTTVQDPIWETNGISVQRRPWLKGSEPALRQIGVISFYRAVAADGLRTQIENMTLCVSRAVR